MSQTQSSKTVVGVGIDTHRYFHQATFLDADRQRTAPNLRLAESAEGYAQLRQALEKIAARQPDVHFHILVDAAGQYAANLERYLRDLPFSFTFTFSVGEPARNKHYRQAISPKRADDVSDSYACGRFAVAERPYATFEVPEAFQVLREVASRGKRGDVALGHCLRKLLHLVFAVWKTNKPFDPNHYPWDKAAPGSEAQEETAGHKQDRPDRPEKQVITAADFKVDPPAAPVKEPPSSTSKLAGNGRWVDFAWLRQQVTLEQILNQAGCLSELKPRGSQRRGRCPVHTEPGERDRSFSADLKKNVFQCFDPACGIHGNVLDFWAAWRRLPLREAALDLAETFHLQLSPNREEEPVKEPVIPNRPARPPFLGAQA